MRVYLAGPINGCTDEEAHGWRRQVKAYLTPSDVEFLDPMARDYRGQETANAMSIVTGDKADIDACDVVLAHCTKTSVGTSMEVLYAYERGKSVVIIHAGTPSPWLIAHSHAIYPSAIRAASALLR